MKVLLTLIITLISFSCSCQTNNFSFVNGLYVKYKKENQNYQRQSKKTVIDFIHSNKDANLNIDSIDFIVIPEMLLKRDKDLYKTIDSTDIVKYFDISSMYYNRAFVVKNNVFIGHIIDGYAKFGMQEFFPKPKVKNFVYESYCNIICIFKPDIVFSVQNMGFWARGGISTLSGGLVGGGLSELSGGSFWDGFRNGAIGGVAGFIGSEIGKYIQQRKAETKAIQEELGLTKEEIRQLKRYGLGKINTKEFADAHGELWEKLKSLKLVDDSNSPYSLRTKDYDRNAIIKSGKIHLRYSTQKMIDNDAYRLNLTENDLVPGHYFNIHYDRFDVVMFPVTHLIFDSIYQMILGVK